MSWGSVWWGREFRRKVGIRRIGRQVGPSYRGWGLQLSLGFWHGFFVVWF